ncbi:MAG: ATP-binding protein [Acidimicrobiales bacterium]|nr:ATP-binding protein [Acidimicrobiales bacterium]
MLLRFEVANHRSILEPVEISMIAVDGARPAARGFSSFNEHVLSIAGIYGPNASGKSNVLDAISWLAAAVGGSLRYWDEFIPRDPFRLHEGQTIGSTHAVEMVVNNIRYAYRAELDDASVRFEGLYSYPERRRRVIFEREDQNIRFRRGLGSLAGTKEMLTPTTLALSASMRFDEPEIQPFGRALSGIQVLGLRHRALWRRPIESSGASFLSTESLFNDRPAVMQSSLFEPPDFISASSRDSALSMLRFADLGIDDVQVAEDDFHEREGSIHRQGKPSRQLSFMHRVAGQQVPLDLADESVGTQTWFALIGPVLGALRSGQVLLFDEIDASLHPKLSARLLELFQDPETNPLGAQLIFTTHDTSLLNHLNRDEVWLTEKGENGATTLTALAEYGGDKVRRSLNLERAYLQGRFGAVPELDQYILKRALGLSKKDA